MRDKVDVLGRQLAIGDFVIRSSTYKGLFLTTITGFSSVMVKTKSGLEYPEQLLLITPEEAKQYEQHS